MHHKAQVSGSCLYAVIGQGGMRLHPTVTLKQLALQNLIQLWN